MPAALLAGNVSVYSNDQVHSSNVLRVDTELREALSGPAE